MNRHAHSHDRWFLDRVTTGILAFEREGQVTFYEGNYSSYAEKWGALARERTSGATAKAAVVTHRQGAGE